MLVGCKEEKAQDKKTKNIDRISIINNGWIRAAAKDMNSSCYFDIINNTNMEDSLLGTESDLAKAVQTH